MSGSNLDQVFEDAGREWNVDPNLLRAVAAQESGGNVNTPNSPAGAQGLMQFMPGTAQQVGVTNTKDPVQAIFGAAKLLSQHLDKYGRPELALAAYNAGPGAVDDFLAGKRQLPAETQAYVPGVAAKYHGMNPAAAAHVPSDDDFIKMTTGASNSNVPSDDDFLKATGAAEAPAEPPAPAPTQVTAVDDLGRPVAYDTPAAQPAQPTPAASATAPSGTMANVGAGAVAGSEGLVNVAADPFGNLVGNPLVAAYIAARHALSGHLGITDLTPQERSYLMSDDVPQVGTTVGNALLRAGGAPTPDQVVAATPGQQIVRSATAGLVGGGALGAPAAGLLGGGAGQVASNLVSEPYKPLAALAGNVAGAMAPSLVMPTNRLAPAVSPAAAPVAASVTEGAAAAPEAAGKPPAPNSVGAAATPQELTNMTPAEIKAYGSSAEGSKLIEPQPIGQQDATEYVPGVQPTQAHIALDAAVSRAEKVTEMQNPQPFKEQRAANNDARTAYYDQIAGNPVTLLRMVEDRNGQALSDLANAWSKKQPVDPTPVVEAAQQILDGPAGRRGAVQQSVNSVLAQMTGPDGKLITDPEMLYGVRQHITDMLDKQASADNSAARLAQRQLLDIKGHLDQVIEQGAPGYKQYLTNYAEASKPIEAQQFLQDNRSKLFDSNSVMQPARVQNLMRQIVDARGAQTLNPAQSLSEDQMTSLWRLRDDLRRQAAAENLARAPGSDTAQNTMDIVKGIGGAGAQAAAHGVVGYIAPGVGNLLLKGAQDALASRRAARNLEMNTRNALNPQTPLRPFDQP